MKHLKQNKTTDMHDKKSDHYTSAEGYRDLDGNSKSFTFIDHDVKTKISAKPIDPKDFKRVKKELKDYKKSIIEKIMEYPASFCPEMFSDFTIRGDVDKISWNKEMLSDPGFDIQRRVELYTILSNRQDLIDRK